MTNALLSCVTTEGGLLPPDLLHRILAEDKALPGLAPADYHLDIRLGEAASRAWIALQVPWRAFRAEMERQPEGEPATRVTIEKWLLPLFRELGYGWLRQEPGRFSAEGQSYPFAYGYGHVPLSFHGAFVGLDRKERGSEAGARMSPHGLLQHFLNLSDGHLWGFVSNGVLLRILRDHHSLTSAAYVEIDLERIFDGGLYSEFLLVFLLCHQSRVEAVQPQGTWLEKWFATSQEEGVRALDRLRQGVETALAELGRGFLEHTDNSALKQALRGGELSREGYFRELLRLVYRVLFLFVAEDRDALVVPAATPAVRERYLRYYSSRRLRDLALASRGSAHTDAWTSLRLVLGALWEGEPALGLPALGSGLFDPRDLPHLTGAELTNERLFAAIRALSEMTQGGRRIRVSYRNLGAQELGSVYESLLELHPKLDVDAGDFGLFTAAGHERKTTGSYYTPASLVECLLDTALDPVVDGVLTGKNGAEAEAALLAIRVCDPACGSGHFLVAAARRMANRLARLRAPDEEPSPAARRRALRDVVGHCLFGVDSSPMAVELCKVSLWMEALEPGRPLSFLNAHIQCGNALLGATPALLSRGIVDEAFEPIEGDDKKIASALKKQNKRERAELALDFGAAPGSTYLRLGEGARAVDAASDDDLGAVRAKEEKWAELVRSAAFNQLQFRADLWCSAFVWKKETGALRDLAPTEAAYRRLAAEPLRAPAALRDEVKRLRDEYQFFHWHLAFPQVLRAKTGEIAEEDCCGWEGGFDVVLGNPPWERIKLQEQEFFAERSEKIARAMNSAARKRLIRDLEKDDPGLWTKWKDAQRRAEGESHVVRMSGRFPLCGKGDVNTYSVFSEHDRHLLGPLGRAGFIVPSGIAMDDTTKDFFSDLVANQNIVSLYHFENEERVFPAVHHSYRFCLLTLSNARVKGARFVAYARSVEQIGEAGRSYSLESSDFDQLNPNTRTFAAFRWARDAEITKGIHRRVPILFKDSGEERVAANNTWGIQFVTMFHMANDSGFFRTRADLSSGRWLPERGTFVRGDDCMVPLYEAKMVHHFDHRLGSYEGQSEAQANQGTLPETTLAQHQDPDHAIVARYWVDRNEVDKRLDGRWSHGWLLGWRDVCRNVDRRTVIASVFPRVAANHKLPIALVRRHPWALCAYLSSFVLDYVARQKLGGASLTMFVLKQLPVPTAESQDAPCVWDGTKTVSEWVRERVLELSCTAWDLESFAKDCGYDGPPFRWDPERRALLRAELDAAFFHLYGLSRDDTDYVMETFPIVKRQEEAALGEYRTKLLILECYDAMARAAAGGTPYVTRLDPPPADPRVAHPPRVTPLRDGSVPTHAPQAVAEYVQVSSSGAAGPLPAMSSGNEKAAADQVAIFTEAHRVAAPEPTGAVHARAASPSGPILLPTQPAAAGATALPEPAAVAPGETPRPEPSPKSPSVAVENSPTGEPAMLSENDAPDPEGDDIEPEEGEETVVHPYDPSKTRISTRPLLIDSLIKRLRHGEIDLMPDFQRKGNLWSDERMSRLIESLLIRLPLPVFYFDATSDEKWLVVDGLQRISTINRFVVDQNLRLQSLEYLKAYEGKRFSDLPRDFQRRIEETQITAHVIEPGTPPEVKYNLYRRINTGGLVLTAQEIRHAINPGKAADLLRTMGELPSFRQATRNAIRADRMLDRELALRFAAFSMVPLDKYTGSMDWFLTDQMAQLNKVPEEKRLEILARFDVAMTAARAIFEDDAFRTRFKRTDRRKPINKALFESWSVALGQLSPVEVERAVARRDAIRDRQLRLMNEDEDFVSAIRQSTADPSRVKKRFSTIAGLLKQVLEGS